MKTEKIIYKNVNELKEYSRNPRENEKAIDFVAQSIRRFGFKVPIVIDKENIIVCGHTRLKASKRIGLETIPCIVADDLSPEEIKAFRLADNKVSEFSEWDEELLEIELQDLSSWNVPMSEFGFDIDFEEENETEIEEDDFEAEIDEEKEPIAKRGDLWKLGNHFLLCGDSTSKNDVEKLMQGNKADLVFTDPPYGISVVQGNDKGGGGKAFGKIGGGKIVESKVYSKIIGDDTTETAEKSFAIYKELSKNQIIFGGNYFTDFLYPSRCWLVWDKENTGNFADVELAWTSFEKSAKLYKWLWNGMSRKGERKYEGKTRVHPTQKPVGLVGEILQDFSAEDNIILDVFGGSGSTLIACEKTNRRCYTMELDEHYCDVIIQRWENLTGRKAELIGG